VSIFFRALSRCMAENVSWEKTRDILQPLIKAPKLTEKLLLKPPFRFLHDIITNLIKQQQCYEGLFTEDEMDSSKVTDRDGKVAFLQKIVSAVQFALNVQLAVRPLKVVSGLEPEATNAFLQALAQSVVQKCDWKRAVEKTLGGTGDVPKEEKKRDESADKEKEKENTKVREKEKEKEKDGEREKEKEKEREAERQKEREKEKERERAREKEKEKEKEREREKESDKEKEKEKGKEKEKKEEGTREKEKGERGKDREKEKEPEDRKERDKDRRDRDKEQSQDKGKEKDREKEKDADKEKERKERDKRRSEEERKLRDAEERRDRPPEPVAPPPPPLNSSPAAPATMDAARPDRLATARKPPPQVKSNVVETDGSPVSKDRRDAPAPASLIVDRRKGQDVKEDSDEDETPALFDPTAEAVRSEDATDGAAGEGWLSKKAEQAVKKSEKKAEGDSSAGAAPDSGGTGIILTRNIGTGKKEKESIQQEIGKLRDGLQTLTKATNPLGKAMDYIQEDIDSMQRELEMWKAEAKQQSATWAEQQRATEEAMQPLYSQLHDLEDSINDQIMKIHSSKANIIRNDQTLDTLLKMVVSGGQGRRG